MFDDLKIYVVVTIKETGNKNGIQTTSDVQGVRDLSELLYNHTFEWTLKGNDNGGPAL